MNTARGPTRKKYLARTIQDFTTKVLSSGVFSSCADARVRDIKVRAGGSGSTGLCPEVFESLIEPAAAQSNDGVGTSYGPEHAGLLEAYSDDGAREVPIGEVPDPDSAIANDDFGRGPLPASAPSLGIYAVAELVGDFDGAHISGRIRIANGLAILIHGSLRKHAAEFAFAGAGSLSFDSASPALGFRRPRRGSGRHPSAHTFLEW